MVDFHFKLLLRRFGSVSSLFPSLLQCDCPSVPGLHGPIKSHLDAKNMSHVSPTDRPAPTSLPRLSPGRHVLRLLMRYSGFSSPCEIRFAGPFTKFSPPTLERDNFHTVPTRSPSSLRNLFFFSPLSSFLPLLHRRQLTC